MKTPREAAESRVTLAKLAYLNAQAHQRDVAHRMGAWSPSHIVARAVAEGARDEYQAALEAAISLECGVPAERVS